MVGRHWGLSHDPFVPGAGPFVSTPGHAEAVERLVYAVDAGERLTTLRAPAGLGKSRVLTEALRRLRRPKFRVARVTAPADEVGLWAALAGKLGGIYRPRPGLGSAWRGLEDAVRLCRWQGLGVVLIVDDAHHAGGAIDWRRLAHLDAEPATRLTLILAGRESSARESPEDAWGLAIRLAPLSRDETTRYLEEKLADAGREVPTFTPRAVTRMQVLAGGLPRGIDRLASLALMAGAVRRLEIVTPEVVEGVAQECTVAGC